MGSAALDLNYLLYCSHNGDVRSENLSSFFNTYYATFASIFSLAKQPIEFTVEQFKKEYYKKNQYGLMMSTILIPLILVSPEDSPSLDDFAFDGMEEVVQEYNKTMIGLILKNPNLKPRFLSVFDEMREAGLFKEFAKK